MTVLVAPWGHAPSKGRHANGLERLYEQAELSLRIRLPLICWWWVGLALLAQHCK